MSVNLSLAGPPGNVVSYVLTNALADAWVPTNRVLFIGFHVTNRNGTARQVDVYWNDGTSSNHFWTGLVPANSGTSFSDLVFPIDPNASNDNSVPKKLRAVAAINTDLTITFSYINLMPQVSASARGGGGAAHS